MLKVIAVISMLVPCVAVTQTLELSKTTCRHILHKEMLFVAEFNKSESFRGYINYYTIQMGTVSVKNNDLFWNCRIS